MTTVLYLVRHGQSTWNADKRVCGQADPPLSRQGVEQSLRLACALRGETLSAVYASTLARGVASARPTAEEQGVPVQRLSALKEIHLGALQGRYRDARDMEAQRLWLGFKADPWHHVIPGAEAYSVFVRRVLGGLASILRAQKGRRALVVGHRGVNKVILGRLQRMAAVRWGEVSPRSHCLHRIVLEPTARIETLDLRGSCFSGAGPSGTSGAVSLAG
jgi:broad specificity phosphatase PhoE